MIFPNKSIFCTLLFIITLFFALTSPASASGSGVSTHYRLARRMVKKRASPLGIFDGSADPTTASTTPSQITSSTLVSSPPAVTPSTSTASISSPVTDSGLLGINFGTSTTSSAASLTSTSSTLNSPSTTPTASSSSTSITFVSSSSLSASSTATPATQTTQAPSPALAESSTAMSTITLSSSLSPSETAKATGITSKSIPKTTLTVIIIATSCVGGIVIIWTVIRKWKFSPSSEFEDRMQPIDWTPVAEHSKSGLHRVASNVSHGSFRSGSEHAGLDRSHSRYNASLVADLPTHDFTAGPVQLGNYADLRRGVSPALQMPRAVSRGPSLNRGYAI